MSGMRPHASTESLVSSNMRGWQRMCRMVRLRLRVMFSTHSSVLLLTCEGQTMELAQGVGREGRVRVRKGRKGKRVRKARGKVIGR